MPRIALDVPAPDFTLPDLNGNPVSLSDYRGKKNVLLVFNRTFA
jgi:peroxiredoxin (alkyl hydroperoxide reductase subunit C)